MLMGEKIYKSLVHTGEWNTPYKEQQEIRALTTKL